jgi:ligand-binding SRPBCC domain-containing protein
MARMEISIEIKAPLEKVFGFLSNPKNREKMFPDTKVEDVSKEPIGVGTRYRFSTVISGRKVKPHWHELSEFEENHRFVDHGVKGGGETLKIEETTYVFETMDGGTKATMIFVVELPYSVVGKLFEATARKGFENWVEGGAKKAKEILEAT